MVVVFQHCYHTLADPIGDGPLSEPVVEHGHQNRNKHMRQPEAKFLWQTIKSRRVASADPLQNQANFVPRVFTIAASCFSQPKPREVSQRSAKFFTGKTKLLGKPVLEILMKRLAHAIGRPQDTPLLQTHRYKMR